MIDPPLQIRAIRSAGVFEIAWTEGTIHRYPFRLLRESCPCAACVNEFTGERILDVASIPDSIEPVGMNFCGNYAIKIQWSDGHSTGLYSWDRLSHLANSDQVTITTTTDPQTGADLGLGTVTPNP